MSRHGLGAMLLMYDENVRYVTSTLTPGWNRLKPGLRYAILIEGQEPILYEQGDIGIHILKNSPWIPPANVRHSFSWIKGAAGGASAMQVEKFTNAHRARSGGRGGEGQAARRGLHRHQHDAGVRAGGDHVDRRHDADDGGARDQESRRAERPADRRRRSATRSTTRCRSS